METAPGPADTADPAGAAAAPGRLDEAGYGRIGMDGFAQFRRAGDGAPAAGVQGPHTENPARAGFSGHLGRDGSQASAASASSLNASTGMQLQNTFLSPCTLSTRATGGQYLCCFSTGSGNTASSRG